MRKFDMLKRGRRKNIAIGFLGLVILVFIGLSFVLYTTESEGFWEAEGLINGTKLAVFVDGVKQENFPTKGSGYVFESVTCENGSIGTWDSSNWQLDMTVKNPDECMVSFIAGASKYVMNLLDTNSTTMNNDDPDSNVRYMGANPNNYVTFNDESWRIIGVFDVASSANGTTEKRVKLIRTEGIGNYSWDSSASVVNSGYGVNEWSQADLMTVLNSGAYYNRTSGTCYTNNNNSTTTCDFSSIGLTSDAKALISDVYWHTGTTSNDWSSTANRTETMSQMYSFERSTNTGKICSGGDLCNDTVTRTAGWIGKVGLMYPSDYGYATSGGSTTNRATCLSTALYSWNGSGVGDCKNNSWLFNNSSYQWTMTSVPYSSNANVVFRVYSAGHVNDSGAYGASLVRPVVHLSADVKITGGNGTSENPFTLAK